MPCSAVAKTHATHADHGHFEAGVAEVCVFHDERVSERASVLICLYLVTLRSAYVYMYASLYKKKTFSFTKNGTNDLMFAAGGG